MDSNLITVKLQEHIRATSGNDATRSYLGMSGIGSCSRRLYREFVSGQRTLAQHDYALFKRGYVMEAEIKRWLEATGIYVPGSERELVAPFDSRFRGHLDGMTPDGEIIEIKSVQQDELDELRDGRPLHPRKYFQVQAYLRYCPAEWAVVVLVSVNFDLQVLRMRRNDKTGAELEEKAKNILAAIDRRAPPRCECGRCGVK